MLRAGPRDARVKSRGCFRCVKMKVKCDEAKPQCQRCQESRKVCPGYRDANNLVFRVETGGAPSSNSSRSTTISACSNGASSINVSMPTDWIQCAISYYFFNYVIPQSPGFPGYYGSLPQLYGSHPEVEYFRKSVEAVALASFAQFKGMSSDYFRRSLQSYGSALRGLRISMTTAGKAYSQPAAASVSMLWMYDVIMGQHKLAGTSPHSQGLLEIMRKRLSLHPDGEKEIDRSILATLHMQNIDKFTCSSSNATPAMAPSSPFPPGVSLLEDLLPQVTEASISQVTLEQGMPDATEIDESFGKLQRLSERLSIWQCSLPEAWSYKVCRIPTPLIREPTFALKITVFPNLFVAGLWTARWLAQMSLSRSMMLISTARPRLSPAPLQIGDQIRSTADLLCSSIPYLLGHVDEDGVAKAQQHTPAVGALFATRVLHVVSNLRYLSERQVNWIMDRLEEIGLEKGIRRALLLRQSIAENQANAPMED